MAKDLEQEESPHESLTNLSKEVRKSFLASDLTSTFSTLHRHATSFIPKYDMPDFATIKDNSTLVSNLVTQSQSVAVDFLTPSFPFFPDSPIIDFTSAHKKIIEAITAPAKLAFSNSRFEFIDYTNFVNETFKGISSWAETYNIASKNLAPIFSVADNIKSLVKSSAPSKELISNSTWALFGNLQDVQDSLYTFPWKDVYPDNYFDYSGNEKIFNQLTEGIYHHLRRNSKSFTEDELTIEEGISLALNLDIQNSGQTNLDVNEFLQSLVQFFKSFYFLSEEKILNAVREIKQKYGTIALFMIFSFFYKVGDKVVDKGIDKVVEIVSGKPENSSNRIVTTEKKLLKVKPDGRSRTIAEIPTDTPIIIISTSGEKWIFIQFINEEGQFQEGWILNSGLLY